MHECDTGEIRDVLPEYVHGQHDAVTRARVEAHLAACLVCAEELAFLRLARESFITPVVDLPVMVRAVVSSMPTQLATKRIPTTALRPSRLSRPSRVARWLIAAGVSFLLVGGASVHMRRTRDAATVERGPVVNVSDSGGPAAAAERGWSDLSYDQLQQLLESIDGADPVPSVEPAARTSPIIVPAGAAGHTGGG